MFPERFISDSRLFQNFLDYFYRLAETTPDISPNKEEEDKIKSILWAVMGFTGHDIQHLAPYQWRGNSDLFLWDPNLHFPNIADAIENFTDCTEGVWVFLSPDTPPLQEYDIWEILARNMRKIKLRSHNYKNDPTSWYNIEQLEKLHNFSIQRRRDLLEKGIWDKNANQIQQEEYHYKAWTDISVHDCIEYDFRWTNSPLMVEKWNRGIVFLIVYNIIKNGYKMIGKFADFSMTLEALYRDLNKEWTSESEKSYIRKQIIELEEKNHENRLFREEIDRRGGKLKISAEVVDAGDAFVIHIWDNATGFDLNGIKRWIKEMVESKYADFLELCLDPILPQELRHGLKEWQKNPHMSGVVSAHMPEFIKLARFSQHGSSGLGLFGSEVLARKLWWSVLAAEMINGWAFFSVVVPKDARKWIDKPDKQTKTFQRSVASRVLPVLDEKLAA